MARVIWPDRALADLDQIAAYIRQFDPLAAASMKNRLFALGESLADFPNRGRPASRGARELVTIPPYVLRYRVADDLVVIVRVRHGRRRPLR
jgi:addiction module RelE/StbE family toxin